MLRIVRNLVGNMFFFGGILPFTVVSLFWWGANDRSPVTVVKDSSWRMFSAYVPSLPKFSLEDQTPHIRILDLRRDDELVGTYYVFTGNRCHYTRMRGASVDSLEKIGSGHVVEFTEDDIDTLVDIATILIPDTSARSGKKANRYLSLSIGTSKDFHAMRSDTLEAGLLMRSLDRFLQKSREKVLTQP